MIDSTIVRVHQHSAGAKKRGGDSETQALGRSKGGLTTKIHAVVDALGNPVRVVLAGSNRNDTTQPEILLNGLHANYVLADKGYDKQNAIVAVEKPG